MYREAANAGVLKGVLSGPYTGGHRQVDAAKLAPGARQRLADVLAGRAEPTPILHERRLALPRFSPTWAILLGGFALFALTAWGYANRFSAWAVQPSYLAVVYAALHALLAFSLLATFRRRARVSGGALAPGRFLLPLDLVEVGEMQRDGTQLVDVTPLGDARAVRVVTRGADRELLITLARGAEIRFALRSESDGEQALRRLGHTQSLLEDLTYHHDRERALASDAWFDVRAADAWAAVAPAGAPSRRARTPSALLQGSFVTVLTLTLGMSLGVAWLGARNWASARALACRADLRNQDVGKGGSSVHHRH